MKEKLYEQPRAQCSLCGQCPPRFDQVIARGDAFVCLWCVTKERNLLRIGMSAGRAVVERPKTRGRKRIVAQQDLF